MKVSDDFIEKIKESNDIVDVIGESVKLKRAGRNYSGLCPFHNEKTPSFSVSRDKQIFKCFGCGAGGNVITYVMKRENLTFPEALRKLADRANIEIPASNEAEDSFRKKKDTFEAMNVVAARHFYKNLKEDFNAKNYFLSRGLTEKTITKFGLGYAKESWDDLLKVLRTNKFTEEEIKESGLVSVSAKGKVFDRFRNRVIYPVFDHRGRVIGFGARVLDDSKPKYLNSPETLLFRKGTNLYGLNFFLKEKTNEQDTIIIVEGYMDVIALHQAGINNVVASLGTALTDTQVKLMKRNAKKIVTSFDADGAGQMATLRSIEIIEKEGIEAKVLIIPDGKDPDEFVKRNGKAAFEDLVNNALNITEFRIMKAKEGLDLSKEDDKIKFFKKVSPLLRELGSFSQNVYVKKLAEETQVSEEAILAAISNNNNNRQVKMVSKANIGFVESGHMKAERYLLKLLSMGNKLVIKYLSEDVLAVESHRFIKDKIFEYLESESNNIDSFMISRLQDIESSKEWTYIQSLDEFPNNIDIDILASDYIESSKVYNLKKQKNILIKQVKALESQGKNDEANAIYRELMDISKKLGGK